MTVIKELLNKQTMQAVALTDNTRFIQRMRYCYESTVLGHLARYALNKDKNVIKERFENLSIDEIFKLLQSEIRELQEEFFDLVKVGVQEYGFVPKKAKVDYERALEELADIAGCLVGLLAFLAKEMKE